MTVLGLTPAPGFRRDPGRRAPPAIYCASVSPSVRCVSAIVRRTRVSSQIICVGGLGSFILVKVKIDERPGRGSGQRTGARGHFKNGSYSVVC